MSSLPAEPIIDPNDFKSLKITIQATNLDTLVEVRAGRRFRRGKVVSIRGDAHIALCETREQGMLLEVPTDFCMKGHSLALELRCQTTEGETRFEATGTIAEVERNEIFDYSEGDVERTQDRVDTVAFEFSDYDAAAWDAFLAVFARRQAEIESFFQAVKGY